MREVKEETGCEVELDGDSCIASVEERRDNLHQLSYCYQVSVIDDTGCPTLEEDEERDGLTHEFISTPDAIKEMADCQPTSDLGRSIKERDLFLIQSYYAQSRGKMVYSHRSTVLLFVVTD